MTDGTSDTDTVNLTDDPSEPSMEDILASIRQLIADDDAVSGEEAELIEGPDFEGEIGDGNHTAELVDIVTDTSEAPLELTNPLNDETPHGVEDVLSEFSFEVEESSADSLNIPGIEIASEDRPLDAMTDDISEGLELSVPAGDRDLDALMSDNIVDDLMGNVFGDDDVAVSDAKVEAVDMADTMGEALNDDQPSDSFDAEMDGLLNDMIVVESDAIAAETEIDLLDDVVGVEDNSIAAETAIDFDTDTSDIDSILSEIAGELELPSEDATPEAIVNTATDDMVDIDNLLDEMAGTDIFEEDVSEGETDIVSELPTDYSSVTELSDLMDTLGSDEGAVPSETDIPEINTLDTDSETFDDFSLDDLLSGEGEADEQETNVNSDNVDPDIALVKSLMADLTAQPIDDETDFTPDNLADIDVERNTSDLDDLLQESIDESSLDSESTVAEESDVIDDLIAATIESEEELQDAFQESVDSQIDEIPVAPDDKETERLPDASENNLSQLADKIETDNNDGLAIATGAAVASTGVAAAIMANTSNRKSALENLLEGLFDEEAESETEAVSVLESVDDSESNFGNLISDLTEISDNEPSNESPADNNMIDDVLNESEQALRGETNAGLGDGNDLGIELDVPELDNIDEILDDGAKETVDTTLENVQATHETSQMETEDMAGKTARDTILDEVTETATASAFASLNQVVDEKNIVEERGERIGDLVTEALKPMLKEWLDANLKTIVERAVTKEVKRISSGK